MNRSIYQLEFKLFFRNRAALAGILILLITGFAGLYFGKEFIAKQNMVIDKAAKLQLENTARNVNYFGKELGTLLYHNKFSMANVPDQWAAFSGGQRDINPYLVSVTMLGLEGQLYDTDLNNPSTLLLGNMDLAFVFIFLFPLVIIAFSYNLLSGEKESGIWGLLRSQSGRPLESLARKLLVRVITVFLVALLLMSAAAIYLQLALDLKLLAVLAVIFVYLSFWFVLSFWIISLGKSSSFNAVSLIAFWIALNVVCPALVNVWLTEQYPVPEAMEIAVQQREGYHEKWDVDKSVTMSAFFRHYPEFKKYPFPAELTFSWYWYYAMQQNGDDQAAPGVRAMAEKLAQRQKITSLASLLLPGIQAQLILNGIAGSDLESHLEFQRAIRKYHERMRLYFYPAIFQDKPASSIRWAQFSLEKYQGTSQTQISFNLFTMTALVLLFGFLSWYNFRKNGL